MSTSEGIERRSPLAKVDEAKAYLNISRSGLYKLMDEAQLAYVKVGGCRRIAWQALDAYIRRNTFGDAE